MNNIYLFSFFLVFFYNIALFSFLFQIQQKNIQNMMKKKHHLNYDVIRHVQCMMTICSHEDHLPFPHRMFWKWMLFSIWEISSVCTWSTLMLLNILLLVCFNQTRLKVPIDHSKLFIDLSDQLRLNLSLRALSLHFSLFRRLLANISGRFRLQTKLYNDRRNQRTIEWRYNFSQFLFRIIYDQTWRRWVILCLNFVSEIFSEDFLTRKIPFHWLPDWKIGCSSVFSTWLDTLEQNTTGNNVGNRTLKYEEKSSFSLQNNFNRSYWMITWKYI